jgi:NADH dehydrogenase
MIEKSNQGLTANRPRVIVIGGGFGGIRVVKELSNTNAEVILVDKRNYHLFQPLLYQVATATLDASQIALRYGAELQPNCMVFMSEVTGIDPNHNVIQVGTRKKEYVYDYLVVAVGCEPNYFGKQEWRETTRSLKTLSDAIQIRQEFLLAFERAENCQDVSNVSDELTFVIVGGGATGVELAGAMSELTHHTFKRSFRRITASDAKIILIDSGDRLLKAFPEKCSQRAKRELEQIGVEVMLCARVVDITPNQVRLERRDGTTLEVKTKHVFWATGVSATPLTKSLGHKHDAAGRVEVASDLTVEGHPNVYVIGDAAKYIDPRTQKQVPGVVQGALQMGTFVGRDIANRIAGKLQFNRPEFHYVDKGSMATIGRGKAVVNLMGLQFGGFVAWLVWAVVHSFHLFGLRNQISTLLTWVATYRSYDKGVRLIAGEISVDEWESLPDDPRLKQLVHEVPA